MSTVNLAEVVGHFTPHGATAEQTEQILGPLPIEYFSLDFGLALDLGLMLPATARPACPWVIELAWHWRAGWDCQRSRRIVAGWRSRTRQESR